MRQLTALIVGAAAIAVMLAGCVPVTEPAPEVTTAAPPVSPTPTSVIDPMAVLPFGGSCENVLTLDEVDAVRPASEYNAGPIDHGTAAVDAVGGIECIWLGSIGVFVSALPAHIAAEAGRAADTAGTCDASCAVSSVVDGTWVQVRAGSEFESSTEVLLGVSTALLPVVESRIRAWPGAVADSREGTWSVATCDAVAESIDLDGLLGPWVPEAGRPSIGISIVEELLVDAGRMTYCVWSREIAADSVPTVRIEITVAPSAGGLARTLVPRSVAPEAPPTTPFAVVGAVETGRWDFGSYAGAIVSDGVNRIQVVLVGDDPADPEPVASSLFAALASTR